MSVIKRVLLIGFIAVAGLFTVNWFYPVAGMTQAMVAAEQWRLGLTSKQLQIGDEQWPYLEGGNTNGEPVVLIHGFGADGNSWLQFAARLDSSRYRLLIPDLPGFGANSREPGDYRIPAQAERLQAFLQAADAAPAHLAGNSMGGHLIAYYASEYPEQVLSLAPFDPAGVTEPNVSPQTKMFMRGENPMRISSVEDYDRLIAFVSEQPPFAPRAVKRMLAERAMRDRDFHEGILQTLINDPAAALEARLPTITAPTLVIWGKQDRAIDVSAAAVWQQKLPNSELWLLDNTGHIPMTERPAETAARYEKFLQRVSAERSPNSR